MSSPKHIHEESDAFTFDFCKNHSHPASPASLYLTLPRPRAPYLMSLSPSSRVPKFQVPTHASRCPRPLVPVPLLYTAKRKKIKTASEHKSSPQVPAAGAIFRFSRMRAWGRVALPMNKMASWLSRLSWLSHEGYTQICVARETVSWGSKDNDAAGELQLWYHERDDDYCLYASKTARDNMAVKVIDAFTLHCTCTDKIKRL